MKRKEGKSEQKENMRQRKVSAGMIMVWERGKKEGGKRRIFVLKRNEEELL